MSASMTGRPTARNTMKILSTVKSLSHPMRPKNMQTEPPYGTPLSYELAEEIVRDYVQRNFVDKGMCADWAIHDSENDKGQRNLHIHVLLTMRPLTKNGECGAKQKKVYDLDENGEKIPVIDKKTGKQKVDKRNRKQWK